MIILVTVASIIRKMCGSGDGDSKGWVDHSCAKCLDGDIEEGPPAPAPPGPAPAPAPAMALPPPISPMQLPQSVVSSSGVSHEGQRR